MDIRRSPMASKRRLAPMSNASTRRKSWRRSRLREERGERPAPKLPPQCARAFATVFPRWPPAYGITPPTIQAHFLGQMAHESAGFSRMQENLNYSAKRIPQVWPRLALRADVLAGKPEALANAAYGGRLGNGPEALGDG